VEYPIWRDADEYENGIIDGGIHTVKVLWGGNAVLEDVDV